MPVWMSLPLFRASTRMVMEGVAAAPELGFEGVFLIDHLMPPHDHRRSVLELSATLGAVAAVADTRVGTMVMRVPLRGPGPSAMVGDTAARVARRPFVLGLGAGDELAAAEARRYGLPTPGLAERVAMVREAVEKSRRLGGVEEVWIGGRHPRLLEVAVTEADGWNGWGVEVDELRRLVGELRGARSDLVLSWGGTVLLGRDEEETAELVEQRGGAAGMLVGSAPQVRRELGAIANAGVEHLIVAVVPNRPDRWELFASEVLPAL